MKKENSVVQKTIVGVILLAFGLILSKESDAQVFHPVKWSYASKKTGPNEVVVFLKATIDQGWHIYSAYQKDGGPVKTSFTFSPAPDFELAGPLSEPKPVTNYEKVFEMDVSYFENQVIFQQKVHLKKGQVTVKGSLKFMVCNDRQCLPPETVTFSIPVK